MRRRWSLIVTVLIALFMVPQPARAWDWWDWAQEFSGPGPFHNRALNLMFDLCPQPAQKFNETTGEALFRDDGKPETEPFLRDFDVRPKVVTRDGKNLTGVPICYFADFRFLQNSDDDNFGVREVKLDIYEFGVSARLHHAISLGFGGGAMKISTPGHTAWQGVFTGPRLVIKPLLIYGSPEFWNKNEHRRRLNLYLGLVKYYVKEDIIFGHLKAEDFGVADDGSPRSKFDVVGDRQFSTGFIVDATDLVVVAIRRLKR